MKTVIFDLDGTLALIDKRRALAAKPNGKIDWSIFFDPKNIELDEPNQAVIDTFNIMKYAGLHVGIFSGRDEVTYDKTLEWLAKYEIEPDFIKMRPKGSYTPDDVLKATWLEELMSDDVDVLCVYDDRDKVVNMWRQRGIACFQVAPGNF